MTRTPLPERTGFRAARSGVMLVALIALVLAVCTPEPGRDVGRLLLVGAFLALLVFLALNVRHNWRRIRAAAARRARDRPPGA